MNNSGPAAPGAQHTLDHVDCPACLEPVPRTNPEKGHTPGHLNCPACAQTLQMLSTSLSASMSFSEAATKFLNSRATLTTRGRVQYVAPRTFRDLQSYLHTLGKFFGALRLDQIHAGHLRSYQHARANGDGFSRRLGDRELKTFAGAAKINDELGVLKRLMMSAEAWTRELDSLYLPVQEPQSEIQRALSPEEQEAFLHVAGEGPKSWQVVHAYALVALHTTFSSDEMRTLRQGEINLTQGILGVNVRYGKNRYRRREIPLTDADCMWALESLMLRAWKLGSRGPAMHLFLRRLTRGHYDGTQPMSETGIRRAFQEVRDAAGVPWFRLNGFRHTAITRMAEAGIAISVIMRRAGHVCPKMTAHYTHISEQVERKAMMQMKRPVASIGRAPATRLHFG